ncbi:MAG: protein kinase [Acidobacteria bacterium]|nr:protein kinase [Acidobacteriota bacterium]
MAPRTLLGTGPHPGRLARLLLAPLAAALLVAAPLRAQTFPVKHYGTEDGLTHSQVWSILQDSRGYIWAGTTEGANRFDGTSFVSFSRKDGLSSPTVRSIVEDGHGALWFGTEAGPTLFDGRRIEQLGPAYANVGAIWASTRDSFGRVWLGTQVGGALLVEGRQARSFSVREGLASEYVYSMFSDSRGNLWFGHRGAGVSRCKADKILGLTGCRIFTLEDGLPDGTVRSIAEDRKGNIYLGTRGGGIARWDGTAFKIFTTRDGLSENDVYAMLVNRGGNLVVGTLSKGIDICTLPELTSCRSMTMANGLPDDSVLAMFEDREGALWVGYQNGLARIPGEGVVSFTVRDGLPHHTVYALLPERDGSIWVGTLGGLARVRFDLDLRPSTRIESWTDTNQLPVNQVWDIHRDTRGRLWIGTEGGGLCEFDATRGRCARSITGEDGLISDSVIALRETRRGALVVTTTDGVSILTTNPTTGDVAIRNVTTADGLVGGAIYGAAEDRYGRLWVGGDSGLSVIDGKRVRSFTVRDGLPINDIGVLHADSSGTIWIGTNGGGLVELTPPPPGDAAAPKFRTHDETIEAYDAISAFAETPDGRFWLGTSKGAALFDPARARAERPAIVASVDRGSGLVSNEVNALAIDRDGDLWIAAGGGVTHLLGPRMERASPPLVTIESLRTPLGSWRAPFTESAPRGQQAGWLDGTAVSLGADTAFFRVDFRGLAFRNPQALRYQVRLEGYNDDWSEQAPERFKEYMNLAPGRYRFEVRVRAAGSAATWSEPAGIDVELLAPPPWWRHRWFGGSMAAAFLLVAFAVLLQGPNLASARLLAFLALAAAVRHLCSLGLAMLAGGASASVIPLQILAAVAQGLEIGLALHLVSLVPDRPAWLEHRSRTVLLVFYGASAAAAIALFGLVPELMGAHTGERWRLLLEPAISLVWPGVATIVLASRMTTLDDRESRLQTGVVLLGVVPLLLISSSAMIAASVKSTPMLDTLHGLREPALLGFLGSFVVLARRARAEQRRILERVHEHVANCSSLPEVADALGLGVMEAFHSRWICVFHAEPRTGILRAAHLSGMPPALVPPQGLAHLADKALRNRAPATRLDYVDWDLPETERAWLRQADPAMIVPLTGREGRLVGLILLGDRRSAGNYTRQDVHALRAAVGPIAWAIEGILLKEHYGREQRANREVLSKLQESEINLVKECTLCLRCYDGDEEFCSRDGAGLMLSVPVERTIAERYELQKLLGKGGIGAVYEARDLRLNRRVAVKVLNAREFREKDSLARFEREARISARLSHPNLVPVFDFGETRTGGSFLVMELLEGESLRKILERQESLDCHTLARWFGDVLDALHAAHNEYVVHRDLKPENVFVVDRGQEREHVKLLDFGLARVHSLDESSGRFALTTPHTFIGTIPYMSPEQLFGERADERSDIFSVGVMVVECLTRLRPFHGPTVQAVAYQIVNSDYRFPGQSGFSLRMNAVLARCLAKKASERYASAEELRADLIPILQEADDLVLAAGPASPTGDEKTIARQSLPDFERT